MGNKIKKTVDVKIAFGLKRLAQNYIEKHYHPLTIEEENEIKWSSNFNNNNKDFFIYELDENLKIKLYQNSLLCKYIYLSFEKAEIEFIKKFLKINDVFFDIGANIGLFSLYAAKLVGDSGKVYSFEPTPDICIRLKENIKINNFDNVIIENIGLSDKREILTFNTSKLGFDAWNSFANLSSIIGQTEAIKVNVMSLDEYLIQNNINKIDFIKIDVEGWEKYVLKGCEKLLQSEIEPVFMVEFTEENTFAAGYYCGEIYDFLSNFGYKWYSYDDIQNQLILQSKKLHYPYENLFAIKNLEKTIKRINS